MAQVSIDNEVVIRWYIESGRGSKDEVVVAFDYKLPNGKGASGGINLRGPRRDPWTNEIISPGVTEESALIRLKENLEKSGYAVRLEKGHYKSVWVPDER